MKRVELPDGHVDVRRAENIEGVGYELIFELTTDSALATELDRCFVSGKLFDLSYEGEDLSVSVVTRMTLENSRCRYECTSGFLRPGMGGAGG